MADSFIPTGEIVSSQGNVENQGITYNQTGATYNDSRYLYGGFYGFSDFVPLILTGDTIQGLRDFYPSLTIGNSQAFIENQGLTYNQPGVTYDNSGDVYGGMYGFSDGETIPNIVGAIDIYIAVLSPTQNSGMLIGILGLTYP